MAWMNGEGDELPDFSATFMVILSSDGVNITFSPYDELIGAFGDGLKDVVCAEGEKLSSLTAFIEPPSSNNAADSFDRREFEP